MEFRGVILTENNGIYSGAIDNLNFSCRQWTWGEKNKTLDTAKQFDKKSGIYYFNSIIINECLLSNCVSFSEKYINITNLDAKYGDFLLELVAYINEENVFPKYTLFSKNNNYILQSQNIKATLRKLTWGEKCESIKRSSIVDEETAAQKILNGTLRELQLVQTLLSLKIQNKNVDIELDLIRSLPVNVGDFLSKIVSEINAISSEEKQKIRSDIIEQNTNENITFYRLAKEFGWTIKQIKEQDALDVEKLIIVMNEVEYIENITRNQSPNATTIIVNPDT